MRPSRLLYYLEIYESNSWASRKKVLLEINKLNFEDLIIRGFCNFLIFLFDKLPSKRINEEI